MAKRIIWSPNALADRIQLLDYWNERIGSNSYSLRLDAKLKEAIKHLAHFPEIGRKMEGREERFLVKENYLIFYRNTVEEVHILHIWDSRRNPNTLRID